MYLLRFTVGVTAVVDEARDVALHGGIDDLVSGQGHEVVVDDVHLGVLLRPVLELTEI